MRAPVVFVVAACSVLLFFSVAFAFDDQSNNPASTAAAAQQPAMPITAPAPESAVVTTTPPSELSPIARGIRSYRKGQFAEAAKAFEDGLTQEPNSPVLSAWLARSLLKQDRVQEAFDVAQKSVAVSADSPAAHTAFGEVLFRKGQIPESEAQFIASLKLMPTDSRAFLGLSRIYASISLYKKAQTAVEKARQLNPGDPDILLAWISRLPRRQQITELQNYLDSTSFDDPERKQHLQDWLLYLRARAEQPKRVCRLVSHVDSTQTPLQPMLYDARRLNGVGLEVVVNGSKSRLRLDTGASGLLLSRKAAERAGITYVSDMAVGGIGDKGLQTGHVGFADSIKIGELEFKDCSVRITQRVLDDDGLIGADVFSHYLVDIDFPDHVLKLTPLPKRPDEEANAPVTLKTEGSDAPEAEKQGEPGEQQPETKQAEVKPAQPKNSGPHDRYIAPEMKDYSTVYRFGHQLLITTRVNDGPSLLFLIDTGAARSLISTEAARAVTKVRGSETRIKGLSGAVKDVYEADHVLLQFAHLKQQNEGLTSCDLSRISKSSGVEVSGVLGFMTLGLLDVKIDYRDGLVDFIYDRNRH
jgi:tetratricopeptide (TPR) repeat protein